MQYETPPADKTPATALRRAEPAGRLRRRRAKRETLARDANTLAMNDLAFIPPHHQVVSWAMRADLSYTPRADEFTFAYHFIPR